MDRWVVGLVKGDADLLMSTYWREAELIITRPEGQGRHLRGVGEIREFQSRQRDNTERDAIAKLRYADPVRKIEGDRATYVYRVERAGAAWVERFELIRRGGEWRIIRQELDLAAQDAKPAQPAQAARAGESERVASDFQAWADRNRNGVLEPAEMGEFLEAIRALIRDPHPVRTPVDKFFDRDRDGQLDSREHNRAVNTLFIEQPRKLRGRFPEFARLLDFDDDGWIGLRDGTWLVAIARSHREVQPRKVESQIDKRLDANRNGSVEQAEIDNFRRKLLSTTVLLPLPPLQARSLVTKRDVFAYFDLNDNGSLEPNELEDLALAVAEVLFSPGKYVESPLEEYFDRNQDGRRDEAEMRRARQQVLEAAVRRMYDLAPEFAGRFVDVNQNRRIDDDVDQLFKWLFQGKWLQVGERRVSGPVEERLDRNRDGRLDEGELHQFQMELHRLAGVSWLKAPEDKGERWAARDALDKLSDLNRDGFVDAEEKRAAMESLSGPHRVRNEIDRRIDFNGNGEVEPIEIAKARRAAGGALGASRQLYKELAATAELHALLVREALRLLRSP